MAAFTPNTSILTALSHIKLRQLVSVVSSPTCSEREYNTGLIWAKYHSWHPSNSVKALKAKECMKYWLKHNRHMHCSISAEQHKKTNIAMYHLHLFTNRNAKSTDNVDKNLHVSRLNILRRHFLSFHSPRPQRPRGLHKSQQPRQKYTVDNSHCRKIYTITKCITIELYTQKSWFKQFGNNHTINNAQAAIIWHTCISYSHKYVHMAWRMCHNAEKVTLLKKTLASSHWPKWLMCRQ